MSPKQKRMWYLILIALFVGGCSLIILTTLNNHLLFFMMPTDVLASKPTKKIRLGGLVKLGSLQRHSDQPIILFKITDGLHEIPVRYHGITPNLFREGQGVIAEGIMSSNGEFQATYLLAKHDENYMPREVAASLKAKEKCRYQEAQMEKTP